MSSNRPALGRTLIIEDDPHGHRLVYVRHLAQFILQHGGDVTLAVTSDVRRSHEWQVNLADIESSVQVHQVDSVRRVREVALLTRSLGAQHTVVADGDFLAMRLGLRPRWTGVGSLTLLLMRDPASDRSGGQRRRVVLAVKSWLVRRARRVSSVEVIGLRSALSSPRDGPNIALEPVERPAGIHDIHRLRADWNIDQDHFWFGIIGAVTERKNLPLVARAACLAIQSLPDPSGFGLLVAGPCQPSQLEAAQPHLDQLVRGTASVVVVDRLIGSVEFDATVASLDCLVVAHSNEGPSAVLARAAARGVRVLAAGAQSLADDVQQLHGATWTPLDAASLAQAMTDLMAVPQPAPRTGLGVDHFCQTLCRPLLTRSGLVH